MFATHLLPYDPVQKKRTDHAGGKRAAADISDTTGEEVNVSSFGTKKGTGTTGVSLRYHTNEEYNNLPKDQADELRAWRKRTKDAADSKGKSGKSKSYPKKKYNNKTKATIASAVEKKVAEKMKAMEQHKTNEGATEAYIMSIFEKFKTGTGGKAKISDVQASATVSAPSLKGIVQRARNSKS